MNELIEDYQRKINTINDQRPPLTEQERAEVGERFKQDLNLLSDLIKRDLSHGKYIRGATSVP